jgi:hypothetical protein
MPIDEEPIYEFPPDWSPELREQRAMLWAPVSWLLPIWLTPRQGDASEPDYLALKPLLLPRVPIAGELFQLPGHYATVDSVRWSSDGRVIVKLQPGQVAPEYLDELRAAGWTVFLRRDADEWLHAQTVH